MLLLAATNSTINPITSLDYFIPLLTFIFLNFYSATQFLRQRLGSKSYESIVSNIVGTIFISTLAIILLFISTGNVEAVSTGLIASLMPSYARRHFPIEVSGSDNQPASWAAFFVDCHFTILFFPVGINLIFSKLNEVKLFLIAYILTRYPYH